MILASVIYFPLLKYLIDKPTTTESGMITLLVSCLYMFTIGGIMYQSEYFIIEDEK